MVAPYKISCLKNNRLEKNPVEIPCNACKVSSYLLGPGGFELQGKRPHKSTRHWFVFQLILYSSPKNPVLFFFKNHGSDTSVFFLMTQVTKTFSIKSEQIKITFFKKKKV